MKTVKRWTAMAAALLMSAGAVRAQSGYTTVTADLSNACYNNGSVQAAWQNGNPSSPTLPTLNGSPFNQYIPNSIDSTGHFQVVLADTAIVQPNSPMLSSWTITACAKGGSQPACYTAHNIPVTGASMDVTSYFSAAPSACTAPVVQVNGTPLQKQNPQNFQDTSTVHVTNPSNGNIQLNVVGGAAGINQLHGDVTAGPGVGNQTATLANVNGGPGSCGDGSHVCQVTTDAKGRVLSQGQVSITQAANATTAGSLSGTPTLCPGGQAAQGILPNGNATGCTAVPTVLARSCVGSGCYILYSDGTKHEWGTTAIVFSSSSLGSVALTYPLAFTTTTNLAITVSATQNVNGTPDVFAAWTDSGSTSGTTIVGRCGVDIAGGACPSSFTGTVTAAWIADGN